MKPFELDGKNLDLESFKMIAVNKLPVTVSSLALKKIKECRKIVEDIVEKNIVRYGINTGFGKFSSVVVDKKDTVLLQKKIILSHAVGVGKPLPEDIVRGVMLLKLNSFLQGYSGERIGGSFR